MGYIGKQFIIDCSKGGLTGNKNIDSVDPNDMLTVTRNINLHENGREKRGGTSKILASAFGTQDIMGVYDYRLINGKQFLIVAGSGGSVYATEIGGGGTQTGIFGFAANSYCSFETFEDVLYGTNGTTKPQKWGGATNLFPNLTSLPTDWTTNNNPKQFIKHGRGVSERLWAVGFSDTPHNVYASANGDAMDFSDTNVIVKRIETSDGFGIVGGME